MKLEEAANLVLCEGAKYKKGDEAEVLVKGGKVKGKVIKVQKLNAAEYRYTIKTDDGKTITSTST